MEFEQVRFYVVSVGDSYAVWEMTPSAMAVKIGADSSLGRRLDRAPLATRVEAERRTALLQKLPKS